MELVSRVVKYNGQSTGRDKLCRVCQYASKYAQWYAVEHGQKDIAQKYKNLENALSSSRKVLRIGKSLDMIQGALKSWSVQDPVIRTCLIVSKLHQACYLLVDHYVLAAKIGLSEANPKELAKIAARFWLVSLFSNLIRNLYDILNILKANARASRQLKDRGADERSIKRYTDEEYALSRMSGFQAVISNRPVVVDTIKNAADLLLPLTSLGYVNTPTQVQAILGIISSVMGILTVWNPALKLIP